jgi:hypothetical protein
MPKEHAMLLAGTIVFLALFLMVGVIVVCRLTAEKDMHESTLRTQANEADRQRAHELNLARVEIEKYKAGFGLPEALPVEEEPAD